MLYPFNFAFRQKLDVNHIDEWISLDFHGLTRELASAMLAATLILALIRKRRLDVARRSFTIIGFYAALTYSRFLFRAAIVFTPILGEGTGFPAAVPCLHRQARLNFVLIAAMVAGVVWRFPLRIFCHVTRQKLSRQSNGISRNLSSARLLQRLLWGRYWSGTYARCLYSSIRR